MCIHTTGLQLVCGGFHPFEDTTPIESDPDTGCQSTFCKGGVQWKQGVVSCMTLYTS